MSAIACTISVFTPEERDRHIAVSKALFAAVTAVTELPDGYRFHLPGDSELLCTLADFIRDERRCCSFWTFRVEVEPEGGAIDFTLTGPEGAKAVAHSDLIDLLPPEVGAVLG